MEKTWKPVTAGILNLVGGILAIIFVAMGKDEFE